MQNSLEASLYVDSDKIQFRPDDNTTNKDEEMFETVCDVAVLKNKRIGPMGLMVYF